jgi:hypothetical protein
MVTGSGHDLDDGSEEIALPYVDRKMTNANPVGK